eukprot:s865_g12.t1
MSRASARTPPLSVRKLKSLRLASGGPEWEWLSLHVGGRVIAAIPIFKRKGGVLLAVPDGALTAEELEVGAVGAEIPDLGPTTVLEVLLDSDTEGRSTSVLAFDAPSAIFPHIKVMGTEPRWPEDTIHFLAEGRMVRPDGETLCSLAQAWVEEGSIRESDHYMTALEEDERRPTGLGEGGAQALDAVLVQLHNLATAVNTLQADMGEMKAKAACSSAIVGPRPDALGAVAKIAGKPPPTRAKAAPSVALPALPEEPAIEAPGEEEEQADSASLDQMMKMALLRMIDKRGKKSKRSKLGLGLGDSSASEDEEDPLHRLSGAKGTMLQERLRMSMVQHPADYVQTIETLAATALGLAAPGPDTMEKFAREELPIGNDRNMGYMVWLIVKAVSLLRSRQHDQAHLLLLLGLAAVEQFKLDQNWQSAWRMTNLPLPPFQEWRVRDASIAQLRLDHAHSRLVHSTWAAAISARLKDEEVLVKRRGQPKASNPPANPSPKGPKGKGRPGRGAEAEEIQP